MVKEIKSFFLKFQAGVIKIILFFSYFLILGPASIYSRLTNHAKLPKSFKNNESTWVDVRSDKSELDDYLKQY